MQFAFVPAFLRLLGYRVLPASHPVEVSSRPICRRPIASSVSDDAVQGTQLLFGDLVALEEVTDVAHHARALRQVAQEAARIELIDQLRERGVV